MSRTKTEWALSLQREAPGAEPHNTGVVFTCACGKTEDITYPSGRLPPEAIRQKLQRKGWRILRRTCQCPACWGKTPTLSLVSKDVEEPMVSTTAKQDAAIHEMTERKAATMALPSVAQTPDARKIHRAVMGWLEMAYDEDTKRYNKGFSDQSIADETKAALSYVVKCREDYFGVLGTPPEIASIKAELTALSDQYDAFSRGYRKRLDDLTKDYTAGLIELRNKIDAAARRLSQISNENGWK